MYYAIKRKSLPKFDALNEVGYINKERDTRNWCIRWSGIHKFASMMHTHWIKQRERNENGNVIIFFGGGGGEGAVLWSSGPNVWDNYNTKRISERDNISPEKGKALEVFFIFQYQIVLPCNLVCLF